MANSDGVKPGRPDLLGATLQDGGVNFSLFSYHTEEVELLLFDRPDQAQPSAAFRLDPETHRTGSYWHIFIPGLQAGQLYGYRFHGPDWGENSHSLPRKSSVSWWRCCRMTHAPITLNRAQRLFLQPLVVKNN